jgi:hypothetical protein
VKSGSKPKEKDDKDTVFTQIIYDVTKDNHFFVTYPKKIRF